MIFKKYSLYFLKIKLGKSNFILFGKNTLVSFRFNAGDGAVVGFFDVVKTFIFRRPDDFVVVAIVAVEVA